MIDENDSLVSEPLTRQEAIAHGLREGATHVLACTDHDGGVEYVLVARGQCVGTIEKACWRSSFSVRALDLDELRRAEAEL